MHMIRCVGNTEYQFALSGPASVLRPTKRYGVAMAKMIPMLLSCKDWRLMAQIATRTGRSMLFHLSSNEGLTSPVLPSDEFDSEVEAELMRKWQANPVAGWTIERESELLAHHQKIYLPDFLLEHRSGKRLHLEILGFWTPEYLEAKLRTLELFIDEPILIIASQEHAKHLNELPNNRLKSIIWYKTRIPFNELVDRLNQLVPTE